MESDAQSGANAENLEMGIGLGEMALDNPPADELKSLRADVVNDEKGAERSGSAGDTAICRGSPAAGVKRKRASIDGNAINQDRESLVAECVRELGDLFLFYKEVSGRKLQLEESKCTWSNSVVACLLEESNLPFSKLVEEIYDSLKAREGVTLSSLRSSVLSVGQRVMYGTTNSTNSDADVLEDDSESCLWCWEARDMKLLSMRERGVLNIRRTARKKIHERVSALSEMLSALSAPENRESCKNDLVKASVKLGKALNIEGIRSLIDKLKLKNDVDITVKEARLKEKELIKEMERSKQNREKEKKREVCENQKEKFQSEKEIKRLQEEAEKDNTRCEKEVGELKKQQRNLQEAERDQRRRQKEEAEVKKQLAIKKQATIMERFLKCKKNNNNPGKLEQRSSSNGPMSDSSCKNEVLVGTTTTSMDCAFSKQGIVAIENLRKSHVDGWHKLCHWNRSCRWGVRCNPKIELFTELKLQQSSSKSEKLEKGTTSGMGPSTSQSLKRKLLQFDKSHRPAYYGTWSKKSGAVGQRHPFGKDLNLDYDVDSDEEWEEEDPGESLSDCDKDDEESLDVEHLKAEGEDENEDGFVVPDGYLSENEGVQVDGSSEGIGDEARSLPSCNPEFESEEFKASMRYRKYLYNLTEQALQKGQPLVISNLMHEKAELATADLNGKPNFEPICLQALRMQACPGGGVIDISTNHEPSNEDQEVCQSQRRNSNTPTATAASMPDPDLSKFVQSIQSNPNGLSKIVESLQCRFPATPKSQLRNNVREISDFRDNRWQVKEEFLIRLGLSNSPGKGGKPKGIAMYFSKSCLPPEGGSANIRDSSPQPCSKTKVRPGDNGDSPPTDV